MAKKLLLISQEKVLAATNGATKILYWFANTMAARGYEIVVAYPNEENPETDSKLDKSISFYNLNYLNIGSFKSSRKRISFADIFIRWRCKKALNMLKIEEISDKIEYVVEKEKPDVIIPFFMHVTCQLVFGKKYDIPIIQMYHSHPKVYHTKSNPLSKNSKDMAILFNYCAKKIDRLQLFFPSYADYVKKILKKVRTAIIHNPVRIPECSVNYDEINKKIIYLSRIDKNKGQDILIEAFAIIAQAFSDWTVEIYGDFEPKEYEAVIRDLIRKYNLENRVKIMGVTDKPIETLCKADIGAYTSKYEGFPLGLSEALSVGLPCVGLNSATGINELIIDRENGLLTESNQVDVARKLSQLMNSKKLRRRYGENARKSVQKYSVELCLSKWDDLINEVINEKEHSR